MGRAAVSTIRVFSFMEHFQFNIKLVPASLRHRTDHQGMLSNRIPRVDKLASHVILRGGGNLRRYQYVAHNVQW